MRMRSALAVALGSILSACDTASLGERCQLNADCDRNTTAPTSQCVSQSQPSQACTPSASNPCICCPIDTSSPSAPMACRINDAGARPDAAAEAAVEASTGDVAMETAVDASDDTATADACACAAGQFCAADGSGTSCELLLAIGRACSADAQCSTTHCAQGVCCNSACAGAGYSCNADPNLAGLCTLVSTPADASTDVAGQ